MNPDDLSDLFGEAVTQGRNGKQDTLVSGTNIKTINGSSVLGSGDLTIGGSSSLTVGTTAIASGTIGRVLFEGTGNVLQESANLFWDNTNGRLGIGTATPSATLHTVGSITASGAIARGNYMQPTLVAAANNDVTVGLDITPTFTNGAFTGVTNFGLRSSINYAGEYNGILIRNTNNTAGVGVSRFALGNDANTLLCGLNAFSSVYGAYLNNSSVLCTFPTSDLILATNFSLANSGTSSIRFFTGGYASGQQRMQIFSTGNIAINTTTNAGYRLDVNGTARVQGKLSVNTPTAASAVMEVTSTTQGFLPPRMTNAQMLAIATPAAGLVVYDTTNNKHCGYNGTAWQNFY